MLPAERSRFDVVLANHVLYYVDDLDVTLRQLLAALAPGGRLQAAIAPWDNMLLQLWKEGFALVGKTVPYYAAEDVERSLSELGSAFRKTKSPYEFRFPDTQENRLKILRFLFARRLKELPLDKMLGYL